MILSFPTPYPEEALFSVWGRYHIRSANLGVRDSIKDLFGRVCFFQRSDFPPSLLEVCNRIGDGKIYSPEYLIQKHTIYPFFSIFLPTSLREKYLQQMITGNRQTLVMNSRSLKTDIYVASKKVCLKCIEEDRDCYGEAYFHRKHQIAGNYICTKHNEILYECYEDNIPQLYDFSLIKNINLSKIRPCISLDYFKECFTVSTDIDYIMNLKSDLSLEDIREKYIIGLKYKGIVGAEGRINQTVLHEQFGSYYPIGFLDIIGCNADSNNNYNWLRTLTTNTIYKDQVHPVKHLLFIRFLFNSIEDFINYKEKKYYPFGEPPWVCLNPVAEHYMENVIDEIEYPKYGTAKKLSGIFKCSCGYIYSRIGPDINKADQFKKAAVIEHGFVWEQALVEHLLKYEVNLSEIKRKFACNDRSLLKAAIKLGMEEYFVDFKIDIHQKNDVCNEKENLKLQRKKEYITRLIRYIDENPKQSRSEIMENINTEAKYLARYHKEEFYKLLPPAIPRGKSRKSVKSEIDWGKRDEELSTQIPDIVNEIKNGVDYKKLKYLAIANRLGYNQLKRYKNKLPKTYSLVKKYIKLEN